MWLPSVIAVAALAALWQLIADRNPYLLPSLPSVLRSLATLPQFYLSNAGVTLAEATVGLALGAIAAIVLAVAMSEAVVLRRALMPLIAVANVTPVVAIAPALVVAFGFGWAPKFIVTALITFFPILMNVLIGLRSVPPETLQVFHTLAASRWEVLWRLRLPFALPYIFAAARTAFPISLIGAVVAEYSAAGANAGLGTVISVASSSSNLEIVYAAIACLAVMGVAMLALVSLCESRFLSWHDSRRP
ncbi:ABC transporter permease [Micrococcales bacterium 31B]|nr:ABC transporter permease [Micrococcales bacterium 31B]